jgi:hypothetical protein
VDILNELKILDLNALSEKLVQTKEKHYQLFLGFDLSNVTPAQRAEASKMELLIRAIEYVIGQKSYEECQRKGLSFG